MTNLMIFTEEKMKDQAINARDLWTHLESRQQFMNWFDLKVLGNKIFEEGKDYVLLNNFVTQNSNSLNKIIKRDQYGGQNRKDYAVTLETAIYLCISEGTEKGKEVRHQIVGKLKDVDGNMRKLNDEIKYYYDKYMEARELVYSLKLGTPDDPEFMKALATHIDSAKYPPEVQRTIKINNYLLTLVREPSEPWAYVCMKQIWFEALGNDLEGFNSIEELDLLMLMQNFALWQRGKGKHEFSLYGKQKYFRKWGIEHK